MIYLDNAATTKLNDKILNNLAMYYNVYANPSSLHSMGKNSKYHINKARKEILSLLNLEGYNLIFTANASEANNLMIKGFCLNNKTNKKEILVSKIEHSSIIKPLIEMEEIGYKIIYVNILETGSIDLLDLKNKINNNTFMVCVMSNNNETGIENNLEKINKIIDSDIILVSDMCQSIGKVNIYNKVSALTGTFHKIHGPKGIGFLAFKNNLHIKPLITGGLQEYKLRAGTENIANILMARDSLKFYLEDKEKINDYINELIIYFINKIKNIDKIKINGYGLNIVNISILGFKSEYILTYLDLNDICVSLGSACNSGIQLKSDTLTAMSLSKERLDSYIRISFSMYNTKEEIDKLIEVLDKMIKKD